MPRHCLGGSTQAVPRACPGDSHTARRYCPDTALAVPRQCPGSIQAMLRQCQNSARTVPRQRSDNVDTAWALSGSCLDIVRLGFKTKSMLACYLNVKGCGRRLRVHRAAKRFASYSLTKQIATAYNLSRIDFVHDVNLRPSNSDHDHLRLGQA